jgi:hypothetical protein
MKTNSKGIPASRATRLVPFAGLLVSPLLVATCVLGQTTAPPADQDAVPLPPKPSFRASGIQGTTAPSGYSGGATEEHGRQAATLAAKLLEDNLRDLLSAEPVSSCNQQASLLHAALTHPGSFEANYRLGVFYLQHESSDLARKYLLLASQLKSDDRSALLDLAIADVQEHRYAEALDGTDRLLRVDARDSAAHRIRGTVEALNNQNLQALADYRLAAGPNASDEDSFAEGLATLLLGSASDAEQHFLSATAARPGSALLWFGMGLTEAVLGKTAPGIAALLKATELDPDNGLAASLLAQQSGGSSEADSKILSRMEVLIQRHPAWAVARYDHALVLYRMGKASNSIASIRTAADELSKAVSEQPDFAAAHFQLSMVDEDLLQRGDAGVTRESAVSQLRAAVEFDPGVAEWHYRLSRAYARDHQASLAAAELQKFQELKRAQAEGGGATAGLLDGLPVQTMHPATPCAVELSK